MRVAAVVVTYERPQLLKRCVDALLAQTEPLAAVLVFDNGSDAKPAKLDSSDERLILYACRGNAGSAGGFYFGMREAFRLGYDAVWLMDDDGVPAVDALEETLKAVRTGGLRACNSLVIDETDATRMAFPRRGPDGELDVAAFTKSADSHGVVAGYVNFFNGTFVTRVAYEIVGDVKFECFIWGDEADYQNRISHLIPEAGTVVAARHTHPHERQRRLPSRLVSYFVVADMPRLLILARNLGYQRRRIDRLLRLLLAYFLYASRQHGLRTGLQVVAYILDGARNTYRLAPSRDELRQRIAAVEPVR